MFLYPNAIWIPDHHWTTSEYRKWKKVCYSDVSNTHCTIKLWFFLQHLVAFIDSNTHLYKVIWHQLRFILLYNTQNIMMILTPTSPYYYNAPYGSGSANVRNYFRNIATRFSQPISFYWRRRVTNPLKYQIPSTSLTRYQLSCPDRILSLFVYLGRSPSVAPSFDAEKKAQQFKGQQTVPSSRKVWAWGWRIDRNFEGDRICPGRKRNQSCAKTLG